MAAPLNLSARRIGWSVALVALAGGLLTLNRSLVGVFYDDGLYAGLGWALAHGWGYVHPNLPGAPAAVHYPPLYPVVLAPLVGALPLSAAAVAARLLNIVFAAAAWGLAAWHATRSELLGPGAPRWLAGAVVAAAAIAIPWLTVLGVLLSEPLFALLLSLTIVFADRPPSGWTPGRAALLAGGCAALALLTRSIGVAAGAGIVGYACVVRRDGWRTAAAAALPVAVAGLAWGLWIARHRGGIDPDLASDYGSYFETVRAAGLGALGSSTTDLGRPLGVLTLGWAPGRAVYLAAGIPALGVGLYGLWILARRSAVGITLAGYLAILGLWPFPPDRFLWAVLPWIGLAWAAGAVALWGRRRLRVPVAVLAVALAAGYVRYQWKGFAGHYWDYAASRISANFSELLPGLDSLPANAVLATDNEPLVWLYVRRPMVPLYLFRYQGRLLLEPPAAVHRAYLERQGVTHVLLSGTGTATAQELARLRAAYPAWLAPVREWPGGRILYEVRHDR
ncbi:MAG TPA: hypothetical protein VI160_08935 [Gemmatimonadales bacterium]